jgi:hypothetical protein
MAAMSLIALARHFQPTAAAGCLSRKKCVPSKNQSHVNIVKKPGREANSAASSPMPSGTATDRQRDRDPAALILSIRSGSAGVMKSF